MEKFLLTIRFQYDDEPDSIDSTCREKTITLGVFDTRDEANIEGNKALEIFEKHFSLNPYWKGRIERFSNKGGCFGYPSDLVSQSYLNKVPFTFYAEIEKLIYKDVEETILEVLDARKRFVKFKKNEDRDED